MTYPTSAMRLYAAAGERLYVNREERTAFKDCADKQDTELRLLCLTLLYSGCRLSEALNLRIQDIQPACGILSVRTLKKRQQGHIREIPLPTDFLEELKQAFSSHGRSDRLWQCHRSTAWRQIKKVMRQAGIQGKQASPKGLRHSFGMSCAYHGVPITLCCRWMGHSSITVTAIYYQMTGKEELEMAGRLWE